MLILCGSEGIFGGNTYSYTFIGVSDVDRGKKILINIVSMFKETYSAIDEDVL